MKATLFHDSLQFHINELSSKQIELLKETANQFKFGVYEDKEHFIVYYPLEKLSSFLYELLEVEIKITLY